MELPKLLELVLPAALAAVRVLPVVWMVPAFGGPNLPAMVRMVTALWLGVLSVPQLPSQLPPLGPWLVLIVARELLVGVTLGFLVTLTFRVADLAGRWIDVFSGTAMSEILALPTSERSSPIGSLYLILAVVIFLESGGLGRLSLALARSYEVVPLLPAAGLTSIDTPPWERSLSLILMVSAGMFESALGLAAPVLVAMLLADAALGLVARFVPEIQVYFLGLPLKALFGTGLLLLTLGTARTHFEQGFVGLWRAVEEALALWS